MQIDLTRGDIIVIEAALSIFYLMLVEDTPEEVQVNSTLKKFEAINTMRLPG